MGKGKENNKVKKVLGKNVELFPYPLPYHLVNLLCSLSTWLSPYQLMLILDLLTLVCKEITLFSILLFGRSFLGTMERAESWTLSWLAEERR